MTRGGNYDRGFRDGRNRKKAERKDTLGLATFFGDLIHGPSHYRPGNKGRKSSYDKGFRNGRQGK